MEDTPETARSHTFDEYKMYYETTEKVTEHRQSTNRWNYSVAIALLVAIALIVKWSTDKPQNLAVGVAGVVGLCALAVAFCVLWVREIESFKSLNSAKFEVLNSMAPLVRFEDDAMTSYEPFAKEWKIMEASKGAKRSRLFGGRLALKSSGPELFFPRAFAALFAAIGIAVVIAAVASWGDASRPLSPFSPAPSSSAPRSSPSVVAPPSPALSATAPAPSTQSTP